MFFSVAPLKTEKQMQTTVNGLGFMTVSRFFFGRTPKFASFKYSTVNTLLHSDARPLPAMYGRNMNEMKKSPAC